MRHPMPLRPFLVLLLGLFWSSCGGGSSSAPPPTAGQAPAISLQPQSQTVDAGGTATFTVAATGTAPLSYSWRKDGVPISGAAGSSLALSPVGPGDAGSYAALVSNSYGSAASSPAVLTVRIPPDPPVIQFGASPATVAPGGASVLAWTVTNATSVSIAPGIGAVETAGTRQVTPAATTAYTLSATGPGGTATAQATVTVQALPSGRPVIGSFTTSAATIQAGESATLSWTVTGADHVGLTPVGRVTGTTQKVVAPEGTLTYTLAATNAQGVATARVTVTVIQPQAVRTWWVAPAGSDTAGDGSEAQPFATPHRALQGARPGDTVQLGSGTYLCTPATGEVRIRVPNLTLQSAPGEWAVIQAPTEDENVSAPVWVDPEAHHFTLRRVELVGGSYYAVNFETTWQWGGGPTDRFGASNALVEDCLIHHTGADGIKIKPGCDDITIRRCTIHHTGQRIHGNAEGIDNVNGDRMTVQFCHLHDIATTGMYAKGGVQGALIEGNLVRNCGAAGILLGFDTSPEYMDDEVNPGYYELLDSLARNNLVIGTEWAGIGFFAALRVTALHNTIMDAGRTVHGGLHFGVAPHDWEPVPCSPSRDCVFSNNILTQTAGATTPMVSIRWTPDNGIMSGYDGMPRMSNNRYFRMGGTAVFRDARPGAEFEGGLAAWGVHLGGEAASTEGDPGLDAQGHLAAGSPCLDRAALRAEVSDDYDGNPRSAQPDIGADERGAGTPLPVPPPAGIRGTGR